MSRDKHDRDPRGHEGHGGDKGPHREPRQSAHPVTGSAAIAPYRSETNEESGECENDRIGLDRLDGQSSGHGHHDNRRRDQSGHKGKPAGELPVRVGWKQPGGDAANAGNSPGKRHQHDGGKTDERASDKGGDWREGGGGHRAESMPGVRFSYRTTGLTKTQEKNTASRRNTRMIDINY